MPDRPFVPREFVVPRAFAVTTVRSWVRASRKELDAPLHQAVAAWLASDWPFAEVRYRADA